MQDWGKRVLTGALLGAALGVVLGLLLARLLWPTPPAPAALPTATLPAAAVLPTVADVPVAAPQAATPTAGVDEDTLVWISALYAEDGDLPRARARLAALAAGQGEPDELLGDLALSYAAAGHREVAVDLATLASALGSARSDVLAYVATALPPTATPSPTPSLTPTPVPPSPTASPLPRPTSPPPAPAATRPAAPRPTNTPPEPTPLPLVWDHRVDMLSPPIRLVEADVASGQLYWKLVRMEWWRAGEGGNCLIYITTLKQDGNPKWGQQVVVEHGPQDVLYTDPKPGEPHGADYRMNSTLNSYIVYVGGDLPSDRVTGLGMGEWLGGMDHTTFVLVFQLARK